MIDEAHRNQCVDVRRAFDRPPGRVDTVLDQKSRLGAVRRLPPYRQTMASRRADRPYFQQLFINCSRAFRYYNGLLAGSPRQHSRQRAFDDLSNPARSSPPPTLCGRLLATASAGSWRFTLHHLAPAARFVQTPQGSGSRPRSTISAQRLPVCLYLIEDLLRFC